jgi:Mlc titration factor MtfA (ptsG expression regulator)
VSGWLNILRGKRSGSRELPESLWQDTLTSFPFLSRLSGPDLNLLRQLARQFLDQKEFHGAAGFHITDDVALAIAAQACLPVLHIESPLRGLDWYRDFVGIVVHAGPVRAQRERVDEAGIVHSYQEVLTGEAMQDGPVTLSWQDVMDAGHSAQHGYNVVIHEFVHKIDMRDGSADGCPPLPADFMGALSTGRARKNWLFVLTTHYQDFCDKLSLTERFGGAAQWLDPYAAESIDEFFAVASEAYFVNPENFARDFAELVPLFDAFFKPSRGSG